MGRQAPGALQACVADVADVPGTGAGPAPQRTRRRQPLRASRPLAAGRRHLPGPPGRTASEVIFRDRRHPQERAREVPSGFPVMSRSPRGGGTAPQAGEPGKGTHGGEDPVHRDWRPPGRWRSRCEGALLDPPDAGPGDAVRSPQDVPPGPARFTGPLAASAAVTLPDPPDAGPGDAVLPRDVPPGPAHSRDNRNTTARSDRLTGLPAPAPALLVRALRTLRISATNAGNCSVAVVWRLGDRLISSRGLSGSSIALAAAKLRPGTGL